MNSNFDYFAPAIAWGNSADPTNADQPVYSAAVADIQDMGGGNYVVKTNLPPGAYACVVGSDDGFASAKYEIRTDDGKALVDFSVSTFQIAGSGQLIKAPRRFFFSIFGQISR